MGMGISGIVRSLIAAAATMASVALAQESPPTPRIAVAAPVEKPVALESVRIGADIRGSLAVTSVEMRFFNPNRRVLEGELQFPLLPGQRIVGMAMDVNGKLRESVPVEKARGQAIFEEVTRTRIDPALLEVTQGNNYKLRVYPIPPQQYKTVVIRYAEALGTREGQYRFRLPLAYAETLAAFELNVTVTEPGARPVEQPDNLGTLRFERSGRFYAARVAREQFSARGVLELAVPAAATPRLHTQTWEGQTYFYAEVPVRGTAAPRPLPRSVGLVWDSSGSGALRDHARELELLGHYFRALGNAEVRLVRLRDRADPVERHAVRNGDWSALRKSLEATVYDGATHLGAFDPAVHGAGVEEFLLFSDGLSNFGGRGFPETRIPVYAISAALKTDSAALRRIGERSGGRHLDLLAMSPARAAKQLLSADRRLLSITSDGATELVAASPFPEHGVLRIAGVLGADSAAVDLTVGRPGETPARIRLSVDAQEPDSPYAAWLWASLKVAELEGDYRSNRAEILRLGKAHGLATRETSLMVLDRVEDYVRFKVVPPAELRAAYDAQLAASRARIAIEKKSQLERVAKLFLDKQTWWSREFPKERPAQALAPKDEARRADGARGIAGGMASELARESAAPASAPALAMDRGQSAGAAQAFRAEAKSASTAQPGPVAGIQLKRWTPDAPYIARLSAATRTELYGIYLEERARYANSTAFILDAADQLIEKGQSDLGVRVLSNLAEMDLENRQVLRILGYRLLQAGRPGLAIPVFERVLELAPDEPQSWRDLGLAYAADKQFQKAVDSLYEIAVRPWHGRFPEVELIGLAEMNAAVARARRAGVKLDLSRIDARLLKNLPLDLRVVLTWDADNTDIDLWVTDPDGERAFYGHPLTYQGGRMSPDYTGGYGPEEFSLRAAKPGRYTVQVNFYGHNRQTVAGATTLQVKFITGFGTAREQEKIVTLRLRERADTFTVGEFEVQK